MIKSKKRAPDNNEGKGVTAKKPKFSENSEKTTEKTFKGKTDGKFQGNGKFQDKPGFKKTFGKPGFNKDGKKTFGKPGFNKDGKKPFNKPGFNKDEKKGGDSEAPQEKTDWQKFKKDKKELKMKRKQGKDSFHVSVEAKQLYEKLKCRKTENKKDLVEKLYNLTRGDTMKKLVMAHDTARIIQCMLKFASPTLREQISDDLLTISVDMATSKYAHFCVLRMFKYGSPKTKQSLVDSFYGNIVKLASHNVSHKILDHAYLSIATENQKALMRQEFYGDLYKKSKDKNVKKLSDCYKDTAQMKDAILGSVKSNLEHIANKNLIDNSLVHSVLNEYLTELDNEEKKEEIVGVFGPLIPHLLTTRDGSNASIHCFYHSSAKNRRAIIKAIKEHLVKICLHEHGHVFLLAVLNSMDDTKAIKKSLFDPIFAQIEEMVVDKWGRRVIEWFIAPAEKHFIHPSMLRTLDEGLKFGKKDKDVRRKEIQEQVEKPLSESIQQNPQIYLKNGHVGLFTASILNKLTGDNFKLAADALSKLICAEDWKVEVDKEADAKPEQKSGKKAEKVTKLEEPKSESDSEEEGDESEKKPVEVEQVSGIEDTGMHMSIKKILKQDSERGDNSFGSCIVDNLQKDIVGKWITSNRGCFTLVNILQNNEHLTKKISELINVSVLKKETTVGSKILREKLSL